MGEGEVGLEPAEATSGALGGLGSHADCKEKPREGICRLRIYFIHPSPPVHSISLPCFTFFHKMHSFLICCLISSAMIFTVSFHSVSSLTAGTFS